MAESPSPPDTAVAVAVSAWSTSRRTWSTTSTTSITAGQVNAPEISRILGRKRVNERTGEVVPFADVVKGYPTEAGWVIVEPEELEDIAPGRSRSLEIIGFVDLDQRNRYGHSSTQSKLTRRSRKPSQHRDPLRSPTSWPRCKPASSTLGAPANAVVDDPADRQLRQVLQETICRASVPNRVDATDRVATTACTPGEAPSQR
ncbi:Ku protein [Saccharopolyspora shandongensis]|uniref:Ku protein n=1 Tax=Saccharopolyspora shandongensis TaxID=418495 RepID=UPI0033C3C9B9